MRIFFFDFAHICRAVIVVDYVFLRTDYYFVLIHISYIIIKISGGSTELLRRTGNFFLPDLRPLGRKRFPKLHAI